MKRILLASVACLLTLGSLTACAGSVYADEPTPQVKPAIVNPQTEKLYVNSHPDDNGLSHWVFNQKLPNGKTVVCVAAREAGSSNIGISCLPNEAAE